MPDMLLAKKLCIFNRLVLNVNDAFSKFKPDMYKWTKLGICSRMVSSASPVKYWHFVRFKVCRDTNVPRKYKSSFLMCVSPIPNEFKVTRCDKDSNPAEPNWWQWETSSHFNWWQFIARSSKHSSSTWTKLTSTVSKRGQWLNSCFRAKEVMFVHWER